jgi:hypothetical protein
MASSAAAPSTERHYFSDLEIQAKVFQLPVTMKFSAIALTFLGSFIATAYSHPGPRIVGRDFSTIAEILDLTTTDLTRLSESINRIETSYDEVNESSALAIQHVEESQQKVKEIEIGTIDEADAVALGDHLDALQGAIKSLQESLIAKRLVMNVCYLIKVLFDGIFELFIIVRYPVEKGVAALMPAAKGAFTQLIQGLFNDIPSCPVHPL